MHLRSHVSLAVATLWYSSVSVCYALTQDCIVFRLSSFGWIATWVWALPIAADWLLLATWKLLTSGLPKWSRQSSQNRVCLV